MLICHKLLVSYEAAVPQACHVSDVQATSAAISSVCHASVVRGCVRLSASSSLIYHFWFLKHHHSAATHYHHRRLETQLSYPWKLHVCRANNTYFIFIFLFLLSVFVIVFNCIKQNRSYCLHWLYFSTFIITYDKSIE